MPGPRIASAAAATSAAARATFTTRDSGRNGGSDAPAASQAVLMSTIMTLRTATFAAASVAADPARRALANTAAIATHAFGLATPRSAPPANDGEAAAVPVPRAGAVATFQASQRM